MTFFESLLLLLLAAIVLLQVSRRLSLPYPALLASAGLAVALIPGAPNVSIEPNTALALFMAPAIVDAAYDFPIGAARRFRRQLVTFAIFAVVATAVLVAWIGWKLIGLPVAAALAMGAIVAPPDAAAATAVLGALTIPRSSSAILKGESLFNDAAALLLFSAALAVLSHGSLTAGVGLRLALAVPGGLLLGIGSALLLRRVNPFVNNTLGGNLLQFVNAFLIWIAAEHLRVSAVLATIGFAMTLARSAELSNWTRMRVQSFAVWSAVVFGLNVFAFLLMGLQGRAIIKRMPEAHLKESLIFAGIVVLVVIVLRLAIVIGFNRLNTWWELSHNRPEPIPWRQAVLEGWCGMRGFVTLVTAVALPASFPRRDLVVLIAFSVVFATLVLQGLTLVPLIHLLKLDQGDARMREVANGRRRLAETALAVLAEESGEEAENLRYIYMAQQNAAIDFAGACRAERRRDLGLAAILAQRKELELMRNNDAVGIETYLLLQEELDWNELTLLCDDDRRIEES